MGRIGKELTSLPAKYYASFPAHLYGDTLKFAKDELNTVPAAIHYCIDVRMARKEKNIYLYGWSVVCFCVGLPTFPLTMLCAGPSSKSR